MENPMPEKLENELDAQNLTKRKILIVEDNLHNRRIFSSILNHYGYQVLEAVNGAEAIEMAQTHKPDLILMDLQLPVMDGWEATRKIKEIESLRHIPIIALTAHAMLEDQNKALKSGCDGYLAKPISPKKVAEEVHRFLDQDSSNRP